MLNYLGAFSAGPPYDPVLDLGDVAVDAREPRHVAVLVAVRDDAVQLVPVAVQPHQRSTGITLNWVSKNCRINSHVTNRKFL